MNTPNLQKQLDLLLSQLEQTGARPRLLLHSCCAPCSSYVLEYLAPHFELTVFYSNSNIDTSAEFRRRADEQKRLLGRMGGGIPYIEDPYDPAAFIETAHGLEAVPEGGARCARCFRLRLSRTADAAGAGQFAYVGTTLSVSPHKNAALLDQIGREEATRCDVLWLPADFKKREGYKRSIRLSEEYGLYRQDYCGCAFSRANRL